MPIFSFSLISIGFLTRFIIAFVILSYLYSNNKADTNLKRGLNLLMILGAVALAIGLVLIISLFAFGGIGVIFSILGNALPYFPY